MMQMLLQLRGAMIKGAKKRRNQQRPRNQSKITKALQGKRFQEDGKPSRGEAAQGGG